MSKDAPEFVFWYEAMKWYTVLNFKRDQLIIIDQVPGNKIHQL